MHSFDTRGVCSRQIHFDIEDGKVHNVEFIGGCNGNLKAVSKLVEGQDVDWVVETLSGNQCKNRPTSCCDQFAQALKKAQAGEI